MNDAWLINIGNTHTRLARLAAGKLMPPQLVTTAAVLQGQPLPGVAEAPALPLIGACVVPAARDLVSRQFQQTHWLSPELASGLNLGLVDSSTLGADRLANAIAACHELILPAVVLDCGTALTTVVVDVHRRLLGGAILAGRAMLRRALHTGTGQLPELPLTSDCPGAIGRNTRDALLAGIDLGILGTVQQVLEKTRQELQLPALQVIAIGGDAPFFTQHLERVISGPTDFTLRGLAWVARGL
jgi:type III pantothenate kinase